MTEKELGEELAARLRGGISSDLQFETRRSFLYALAFEDGGRLRLGLKPDREPVRGGGTGFEQRRSLDGSVHLWVAKTPSALKSLVFYRGGGAGPSSYLFITLKA